MTMFFSFSGAVLFYRRFLPVFLLLAALSTNVDAQSVAMPLVVGGPAIGGSDFSREPRQLFPGA